MVMASLVQFWVLVITGFEAMQYFLPKMSGGKRDI